MANKLHVRKGDNVVVIAGKDKGKTGKIVTAIPSDNAVIVEGVNIITKHQKPKSQQDKGGIVKREGKINASNVQIVCPACGKATRVAHDVVDGQKHRVCKHCHASLDDAKKVVKKTTAKKAEKETTTTKTTKKVAEAKPATKKTTTATTEKKPAAKKATTTKKVVKNNGGDR